MKVLLVEDDAELAEVLAETLRREGYAVVAAHDGEQGLVRFAAERPNIVLLDGALPKLDGFEVCHRIRAAGRTPIIVVTGRHGDEDVLEALRSGADDSVAKPFRAGELLARMGAVLRRAQDEAARDAERLVRWGELVLEPEACVVRRLAPVGPADRPIAVSRLQLRLLHALAANAGRVVPYARLIEHAWGDYDAAKTTLVKSHIAQLHKLLSLPRSAHSRPTRHRTADG